jgi:hypothetical protein
MGALVKTAQRPCDSAGQDHCDVGEPVRKASSIRLLRRPPVVITCIHTCKERRGGAVVQLPCTTFVAGRAPPRRSRGRFRPSRSVATCAAPKPERAGHALGNRTCRSATRPPLSSAACVWLPPGERHSDEQTPRAGTRHDRAAATTGPRPTASPSLGNATSAHDGGGEPRPRRIHRPRRTEVGVSAQSDKSTRRSRGTTPDPARSRRSGGASLCTATVAAQET